MAPLLFPYTPPSPCHDWQHSITPCALVFYLDCHDYMNVARSPCPTNWNRRFSRHSTRKLFKFFFSFVLLVSKNHFCSSFRIPQNYMKKKYKTNHYLIFLRKLSAPSPANNFKIKVCDIILEEHLLYIFLNCLLLFLAKYQRT